MRSAPSAAPPSIWRGGWAWTRRRASEIGIAVTEVATNQLKHAGGGALLLRACRSDHEAGVAFVATDRGPGMSDMRLSLADGHSTAGTLGIGLGAISRLSSTWDIYSLPGRGTVVAASFGPCETTSAGRARQRSDPADERTGHLRRRGRRARR